MRDLAVLFLHLLTTVARLAGPGGARAVVAESVLVKHQLLILSRSRKRSPTSVSLIEKMVPYAPRSHPFVERLIGTIRRECLDRTLFWTAPDLELKLLEFQRYYNGHRAQAGLELRRRARRGRGSGVGGAPPVRDLPATDRP
jgi:Integrase core domain